MTAHHAHRWLAWLLPLLLLRALIPAGFMLSWSDEGRLQLVVCSGTGPMVTQVQVAQAQMDGGDAAQHQLHGDAPSAQHDHSRSVEATMCPFATAGTAAVAPTFAAVVSFVATVSQEVSALPGLDLPSSTVLIDRIRGPPLA
jgi:hypothetical protein